MDIKTQLEELGKAVAKLYKHGVLKSLGEVEELRTSVADINAKIEEINASIEALEENSNQEEINTINAQITEINSTLSNQNKKIDTNAEDVSSNKSLIALIQTDIAELESRVEQISTEGGSADLTELTTKVNENASAISTLSSLISFNETDIDVLEGKVSSNETNILAINSNVANLTSRVTSLEQSGGSGNSSQPSIVETFNMGIDETLKLGNRYTTGPKFDLYFCCEPTAKIKGNFDLILSNMPTTLSSADLNVYLDGNLIKTKTITSFTENMTVSVETGFFPTKKNHKLSFYFNSADLSPAILESINLHMDGRNLMITNRLKDFHLQVQLDYYYITYLQDNGEAYWLEQPITSPDFSAERTLIPNPNVYTNLYKLYRNIAYASGSWRTTSTKYVFTLEGEANSFGLMTLSSESYRYYGDDFTDVSYFHRSGVGLTQYSLCGTLSTGEVRIQMYNRFNNESYDMNPYLNGTKLDFSFAQCIPVYDHFISTRPDTSCCGFILMDYNGKIFYLPDREATYMVEIGMGTQPNAYMQQDNESINVYYNFCNTVYKKVLRKNAETGEFELQSGTETFPGVQEFVEGVNGVSFRRINGQMQLFNS